MIPRRRREEATPFLALRVGIFFLAAGFWVAGVRAEVEWLTAAALAAAAIGLLIGAWARRRRPSTDDAEPEDSPR